MAFEQLEGENIDVPEKGGNETDAEAIDGMLNEGTLLEQVMCGLSEVEGSMPTEEELAAFSETLGLSREELQALLDCAKDASAEGTNAFHGAQSETLSSYCTFAGCQGTCRGCAGRR